MRDLRSRSLVTRIATVSLLGCLFSFAAPQTTILETQRLLPETGPGNLGLHILDIHENRMLTSEGILWERGPDGLWVLVDHLVPSIDIGFSPEGEGYWGGSVADGLVVLGARDAKNTAQDATGVVIVFRKQATGAWQEEAVLFPEGGEPGDRFGASVAIVGDDLFVGAPLADIDVYDQGAVYLFQWNGSQWVEAIQFFRESGESEDRFGSCLATDGQTVVIGMDQPLTGTFGVTLLSPVGGTWLQTAELVDDALINTRFGVSAAIQGDRLVVGAEYAENLRGLVHVFERQAGTWTEVAQLAHPNGKPGDLFGSAVSLQDDLIAVGCVMDDFAMIQNAGSVHLFRLTEGSWEHDRRLTSSEPGFWHWFGDSIHLSGRQALVAASREESIPDSHTDGVIYSISLFPRAMETYCESTQNTTSEAANLWLEGSTSVAANDLIVRAGPVPDPSGLLYYGPEQAQIPFGNGIRCVDGMLFRLSPVTALANVLTFPLDVTSPPAAAGLITPGSTWNFQAWYRDPAAGGSAFNLSAAVALTFEP